MSTPPGKTVLITGANAGIGKEVARQLALRPEMARIYLACRNQDRAITAKAELEEKTGRSCSARSTTMCSPIGPSGGGCGWRRWRSSSERGSQHTPAPFL